MPFRELVLKNRSYRRFHQNVAVSRARLLELVDLARQCPSAANAQPLKYLLLADPETNAKIFPSLRWAGALKDWPGPAEGERPAAYIIILLDTRIRSNAGCDHGIVAQTILLGATEAGLGGCMLGAIDRPKLKEDLAIPDHFDIALVVALGKPKETVVLEPLKAGNSTDYYRDAHGVHHVPKRSLEEVVVEF